MRCVLYYLQCVSLYSTFRVIGSASLEMTTTRSVNKLEMKIIENRKGENSVFLFLFSSNAASQSCINQKADRQ